LEPLTPSIEYVHVPVLALLKLSVAVPTGVRFTWLALNVGLEKGGPETAYSVPV
jgi:hypothetical protein